jgi:type I restriction enzyme, S subunit
MSRLPTVRLGDCCLKIGSGATPRGGRDAYRGGATALIRSQNVHNWGFTNDGLAFIDEQQAAELSNVVVEPSDVLLNITGDSVARCCMAPAEVLPARVNQHVLIIRTDPGQLHSRYLRYWVVAPTSQQHLLSLASAGATRNALTRGMVSDLRLDIPPLPEQRAIASVLGALDDKIDLNRRMCQTLEEMARALFKSWFVENPEPHWKAAPLGEWVEALSGGTPSKADASLWGGALKWISPKAMTSIHADECDDYVTTNAVGNGTKIAPKGSTLVMVRGMGLHDGVRISQAREDVTFNQDVKALVPKKIHPDLLLFAMLEAQSALHQRVESSGHGTGKLPSELLLGQPIKLPSLEEQASRGATFAAFNERIGVARHESRTLAALRDTLLPKLISGELRVPASLGTMQEVAT